MFDPTNATLKFKIDGQEIEAAVTNISFDKAADTPSFSRLYSAPPSEYINLEIPIGLEIEPLFFKQKIAVKKVPKKLSRGFNKKNSRYYFLKHKGFTTYNFMMGNDNVITIVSKGKRFKPIKYENKKRKKICRYLTQKTQ